MELANRALEIHIWKFLHNDNMWSLYNIGKQLKGMPHNWRGDCWGLAQNGEKWEVTAAENRKKAVSNRTKLIFRIFALKNTIFALNLHFFCWTSFLSLHMRKIWRNLQTSFLHCAKNMSSLFSHFRKPYSLVFPKTSLGPHKETNWLKAWDPGSNSRMKKYHTTYPQQELIYQICFHNLWKIVALCCTKGSPYEAIQNHCLQTLAV